ncbi:MAG: hypothetical protein ABUK01_08350 [Leptospirales bacterium]
MSWIGPVLVAIIVPLALSALVKAAKVPAQARDGKMWVEYGRTFKIFTFVFVLIPCALGILMFYVDPEGKFPVLMMALGFGALAIPLFLEAFFVRIGFDDTTAYCSSPWRSSRQIKFSDMEEPYYSESMQWWVIPTKTQGKIRLQSFISGQSEFLEKVRERKGN